MLKLQEG